MCTKLLNCNEDGGGDGGEDDEDSSDSFQSPNCWKLWRGKFDLPPCNTPFSWSDGDDNDIDDDDDDDEIGIEKTRKAPLEQLGQGGH